MSEKPSPEVIERTLSQFANEEIRNASELAARYALTLEQAKLILSDPDFLEKLKGIAKGVFKAELLMLAPKVLLGFVADEKMKPQFRLNCLHEALELAGLIEKPPKQVNVQHNMTLDNMLRQIATEKQERKQMSAETAHLIELMPPAHETAAFPELVDE